jgi:hypothetical protein
MPFGGTLAANPLLSAGLSNNQTSSAVKIPQMRSNPLPVSSVTGYYQQVGFFNPFTEDIEVLF